MEIIRKEDIPNWEYGDVCIKRYGFGDKLKLSGMVLSTRVNTKTMEEEITGKEVNAEEIAVFATAAGIAWIKKKDNYEFEFKPERDTEDVVKFISRVDFDAGMYLRKKIEIINAPVTKEEIKN